MKCIKLPSEGVEVTPTWEGIARFFGVSPEDLLIEHWDDDIWLVISNGALVGVTDEGIIIEGQSEQDLR